MIYDPVANFENHPLVLESWDWIFLGITTSFHKSNIDWPHQPPTEMLPILVKICIFDGPFHKKGLVLVIWVPGMINPSGSVNYLMKWGCRDQWGHWGCWGHWDHWGCRGVKAWKITTGDFRGIQVFELSFIFMFWKNDLGVES